MAWLLLLLAGLFEIAWAVALKYTVGFTRLWPTVFFAVTMLTSVTLLGRAVRELPIGTAYAVWTGIGAAGTAVLGIFLFAESTDWRRLACLAMIVTGIVGLKLLARP
jgi:quaternary ammonium compound-resistance protein SugE